MGGRRGYRSVRCMSKRIGRNREERGRKKERQKENRGSRRRERKRKKKRGREREREREKKERKKERQKDREKEKYHQIKMEFDFVLFIQHFRRHIKVRRHRVVVIPVVLQGHSRA